MVINQGDIFWVELDEPTGSGPSYRNSHIGTLSKKHVRQIVDGMKLLTEPREIE